MKESYRQSRFCNRIRMSVSTQYAPIPSPMYHWTDSKIQVHAFYCVLALLLTSLLQRELARKGEPLSINRMLEELGGIRETLLVYPRRPGQRQAPTAACLTR